MSFCPFYGRLDSDGNQAIVRCIKKEVVGLEGEDKFTESEMSGKWPEV